MELTERYQNRPITERPYTDDELEERIDTSRDIANKYPWLAEEIAAVTEAAYRRGYQQGHWVGTDADEIADWRFCPLGDYFRYRTAVTPPGGTAPEEPAIQRLRGEAANASDIIAAIVNETIYNQTKQQEQGQ